MKLVEMKCKNCGAKLKVDEDVKEANCQFCGAEFKIDDEVQHVKYDDMEQAGYEFEKGKLRAQQEHKEKLSVSNNTGTTTKTNKKLYETKTFWIIMAWIFLLPFMATYYIAKNDKLDKKKKIIIIAIMWVVFIIIGIVGSIQSNEDRKNRIIECYSEEVYDKLDKLIGIDNIDGYFSDTYSCDEIRLKDQHYKKIDIEMNADELISIKLDNKCIYNIDETVDIYDPKTMRIKTKDEDFEKLFGKQENNAYYNQEKNIRKFILNYNKISNNKVNKVEWKNNHTIAYLSFESERCKINDHEKGFIITCEFSNGQAKAADYESILKDMIKTYDSNISDETINVAMESGKNNNNLANVSDKITVDYNYSKEAISIRSGDSYIIEMILGK